MDAALNAACLTAALVWRAIVGRVLRRTVERLVGAPARVEHPLLDLLIGVLVGWLGFAVWSAVLKRAMGVGAPPAAFAIVELLVIIVLVGRQLFTTPLSAQTLMPSLHTAVRAVPKPLGRPPSRREDRVSFRLALRVTAVFP
jgi:hypothetical protein